MSFISFLLDRLKAWIDEIDTALDVDFGDDATDPSAGLAYDPVAGRCNGDGEAYCVCPVVE